MKLLRLLCRECQWPAQRSCLSKSGFGRRAPTCPRGVPAFLFLLWFLLQHSFDL